LRKRGTTKAIQRSFRLNSPDRSSLPNFAKDSQFLARNLFCVDSDECKNFLGALKSEYLDFRDDGYHRREPDRQLQFGVLAVASTQRARTSIRQKLWN
jgi:hypothetical protein